MLSTQAAKIGQYARNIRKRHIDLEITLREKEKKKGNNEYRSSADVSMVIKSVILMNSKFLKFLSDW